MGQYTYKNGSFFAVKAMENDYGAHVWIRRVLSSSIDQECPVKMINNYRHEHYLKLEWISSKYGTCYQEGTTGASDVAWKDLYQQMFYSYLPTSENFGQIPDKVQKIILRKT